MLFVSGAIFEWVKFVQLLSWIVLPLLAVAIGTTIFLHNRRKRKNAQTNPQNDGSFTMPDNGEYILFDHSGLIRQYKHKLSYNEARYTALQYDFNELENKYTALAGFTTSNLSNNKTLDMEAQHEKLPQDMEKEINRLAELHLVEKKELLTRIEQLGRSYKSLEEENESLVTQLKVSAGTDDEKATLVERWVEEKKILKDQIAEQDWLEEIVKEKKNQIDFLQNQLEQRIKTHHQVEQQKLLLVAETETLKENNRDILKYVDSLKTEILLKQEVADQLQVVICEKEEQLEERRLLINSKQDLIIYLENQIHEIKGQNEILSASGADRSDQLGSLHRQLEDEQSRAQYLEQKLAANKQMLKRLYKEFSACMQEEDEKPPVIALHQGYKSRDTGETAIIN